MKVFFVNICLLIVATYSSIGIASSEKFGGQLLEIEAVDQANREKLKELSISLEIMKKETLKDDQLHVDFVKEHISKYGWEIIDKLTSDQVDALFLIITHASFDVGFQLESLKNLESLIQVEPKLSQKYALMSDKVLLAQGKHQRFGTQYDVVDNTIVLKPIKNPENLNKIRKQYKLPPIEFYKKILEEIHQIKNHGLMNQN